MLTILVTVLGLAAEEPPVVWQNAYEIGEHGLTVERPGLYHVWIWAKADEPATLQLGSHTYVKHPGEGEGHAWVKVGVANLEGGAVEAVLDDSTAAVAMSPAADFDPTRAMADRRVYDEPRAVNDTRAAVQRDTNTVFTMPTFKSRVEWDLYAARLRRRILISSGLWPLPERTPLNAQVKVVATFKDYVIEKVSLEAYPGYLVTGNLYRPVGDGPFPALACPHGHWAKGRLEDGERGSVPGRCITFARMGIVAFSYDMIGYNDSRQFPHNWGDQEDALWGLHPFALQLWGSVRVLDFLESLVYVDPDRLGCTGASGGGTQTFALTAIDPRVKVAAPVNMISSTMQGGCVCENAPIIRLDASNMEIGALAAPRPLLMVSATGDWTRETPRVEYPAIRSIYDLYGAADRVEMVQMDAGHNYNRDSREAVYRFFGRWLLGDDEKWSAYAEPAFTVESDQALRVLPGEGPPPGKLSQDAILAALKQSIHVKRVTAPEETTPAATAAFQREQRALLSDVLGAAAPDPNTIQAERIDVQKRDHHVLERWVLRRSDTGQAVPALLYHRADNEPRDAVVLVHPRGKAALADAQNGGPGPYVQALLDAGYAVMTIDAFLTGEHHAPTSATARREGRFPDTFLPTDAGYRVQDLLTAMAYLRARRDLSGEVAVAGIDDAGLWALFAGALDGRATTTVADRAGFDADDDAQWAKKFYVPCLRGVGDLELAVSVIGNDRVRLLNETGEGLTPDDIVAALQ